MRSKLFLGCAVAIVVVMLVGSLTCRVDASVGPIPLNCNRACLENVMNQYLAAVIVHNPKLVPLSADVKYTEIDQRIDVGDGLWKTAQGNRPSSILVTEAFLIENGKIRRVEMVGPGMNYHLNSAWPGSLSGN